MDNGTDWHRLKALVLDSISSDYQAGLQPRLGRILRLVQPGAAGRLHQGNCGRPVGILEDHLREHYERGPAVVYTEVGPGSYR